MSIYESVFLKPLLDAFTEAYRKTGRIMDIRVTLPSEAYDEILCERMHPRDYFHKPRPAEFLYHQYITVVRGK